MDYIRQIRAFNDRLEQNPLSSSAVALWYALMYTNNKAGWIEEFSTAASILCLRSGLAERTISKARNELKQKGYIDFRSRKGNQSAVYKMIDLASELTSLYTQKDTNHELSASHADNHADSSADNHADSSADNHATLLNININNKNDELTHDEIFKISAEVEKHYCIERGIISASAADFDEIRKVVAHKIPLEFIVQAMKESFKNHTPKHPRDKIYSFKYCAAYIHRSRHKHLQSQKPIESDVAVFKDVKSNKFSLLDELAKEDSG